MALSYNDEYTTTDSPFLDLLIHNIKLIAYNMVIKDEYRADQLETTDSVRNAELYISCIENHAELEMFSNIKIPQSVIYSPEGGKTGNGLLDKYELWVYQNIPEHFTFPVGMTKPPEGSGLKPVDRREVLTKAVREWYINTYMDDKELNAYYRKLVGYPPINGWGIPVSEFEYLFPKDLEYDKKAVFMHELSNDVIKDLDNAGVLDVILTEYPEHDYLRYKLYDITPYNARKKLDMQILWEPDTTMVDSSVLEEFNTRYIQNRRMVIDREYSYALEIFESNYHDLMIVYLILSVIVDMISMVQQHIIRKDILDRRCVEFVFSMYNVPYFKKIPLLYQKRICQNIHNLVKYKSSTTEMLDLISLFDPYKKYGINIIKYYLLKNRKIDDYGNFEFYKKKVLRSNYNDIVVHETVTEDLKDPSYPTKLPSELDSYERNTVDMGDNSRTGLRDMYQAGEIAHPINNDQDLVAYQTSRDIINPTSIDPTDLKHYHSNYLERYIKFPFDYFLQKGNVMFVKFRGKILREGIDYDIVEYNKIKLYAINTFNFTFSAKVQVSKPYQSNEVFSRVIVKHHFIDNNNDLNAELSDFHVNFVTSPKGLSNVYNDDALISNFTVIPKFIPQDAHNPQGDPIVSLMSKDIAAKITQKYKDPIRKYARDIDSVVYLNYPRELNPDDTTITYEFYYDKSTVDEKVNVNVANAVQMKTVQYTGSHTIDLNPIPFDDYFERGNQLIVSIGGIWLPETMYSVVENRYLHIDDNIDTDGRVVTCIYIYGKKLKTRFEKHLVTVTDDSNNKIKIPEPFPNYILNNNGFFVNVGSTYIDPARYSILHNNDGTSYISFNNPNLIPVGTNIVFNFLYSANAITNDLEIKESKEILVTDHNYQTYYEIHPPIAHYGACDYKTFVKYNDDYLSTDWYVITDNGLTLLNESMCMQKGDELEVIYVYANSDRTEEGNSNIQVKIDQYVILQDNTDVVPVQFPVENYFSKKNKMIVDIEGHYIEEGKDYKLNPVKGNIRLLKYNLFLKKGKKVNFTFIYNTDAEYTLRMEMKSFPMMSNKEDPDKGNTQFDISYPFFPYLSTGQGYIPVIGTNILDMNRITMKNDFLAELDQKYSNEDRNVTCIFVYNSWYLDNGHKKLIVESKEVDPVPVGDGDYINIPVPFEYYIENGWDYFVTYGTREYLDPYYYNTFGSSFYTVPEEDLRNKKYPNFIFTFIYLKRYPYVYYEESEDYDKTTELKFCKVPIDDLYSTPYLRDKTNWKDYDQFVYEDGWWDGKEYKQNNHQILKDQIYDQKWNYARTKYYRTIQVIDLAEYSVQMSYFYSMLYDDVLSEENLKVKIPSIMKSHQFNIAHLFIFMTVLTYIYNGFDDFIIDNPAVALKVQGFNFRASMSTIKEFLRKKHRQQSDFDVWNFNTPSNPYPNKYYNGYQIKDITSFLNIYKENLQVRRTICQNMLDADTYEDYEVWKYLYNSLMNWNLNLRYFRLDSTGEVAKTYTEFLEEKDKVLYNKILSIKSIKDQEIKENEIINVIDDIIYVLDEWFDGLNYIFDRFAGHSGKDLMVYLRLMIDFFKSYKIIFKTNSIVLDMKWGEDRDEDLTMRPIDCCHITEYDIINTYIPMVESPVITETIHPEEDIGFKEDLIIIPRKPKTTTKDIDGAVDINETKIVKDINGSLNLKLIKQAFSAHLMDGTVKVIKKTEYTKFFDSKLTVAVKPNYDLTYYYKKIPGHYSVEVLPEENANYIKEALPNVTSCHCMMGDNFSSCASLISIDTTGWDTSKITDMHYMFNDCHRLTTIDVSKWDTSKVTDMNAMFYDCRLLRGLDVSNWDIGNVVDMGIMFNGCNKLKTLDVSKWDTSNVTDMTHVFYECKALTNLDVSNWNTSNVTNMDYMFYDCNKLTTLNVSNWDTGNVTSMDSVFDHCESLTTLDVSNWNTSKVTNMTAMFMDCNKLTTLDVSKWNTSNVTDMNYMFSCKALTNLDVSKFDTSKVTDMHSMFDGCKALTTLDVSKFDTSKVTNMEDMFDHCESLTTLDVSKWDTSKVTNMDSMFYSCNSLTTLDLSNWDTSNVGGMNWMFCDCTSLTTIKGVIDMKSCTSYNAMFNNCSKLKGVKIKNPAPGFEIESGLTKDQYEIVE